MYSSIVINNIHIYDIVITTVIVLYKFLNTFKFNEEKRNATVGNVGRCI